MREDVRAGSAGADLLRFEPTSLHSSALPAPDLLSIPESRRLLPCPCVCLLREAAALQAPELSVTSSGLLAAPKADGRKRL